MVESVTRGDFIHHGHQARTYAGFRRRVTGVVDDDEFRTGPRAVQLSGCYRGAQQIVTTLHNGRRQVANSVYAVEQLILGLVSIVSKVMDFDACHCVRDLRTWFKHGAPLIFGCTRRPAP
jgi:hypothetical protein